MFAVSRFENRNGVTSWLGDWVASASARTSKPAKKPPLKRQRSNSSQSNSTPGCSLRRKCLEPNGNGLSRRQSGSVRMGLMRTDLQSHAGFDD
jgi:hypothetical protein